jgi:DNA-binding transcriptional regulator YiaG
MTITISDEVLAQRRLPMPAMARQLRLDAGLSQGRLARELNVTRVTVARWEAGTRHPRGELLVAYVRLLDSIREAVA